MAVTAAPTRKGLTRLRGCRAEDNYRQVSAGIEIDSSVIHHDYSTGTTNSLLRTMFRRARAAISIVLGSVRSLSTSDFNDWLTLRKASTSVCIAVSCCAATLTLARVRIFTVTQTAKVASKIMPKTTQEGIIPPRRRTSVRVPMISIEICCTEAIELVRGVTRCDLIRSSTQ